MSDLVVCEFTEGDFPNGVPSWCPSGWAKVQVIRQDNGRHAIRVTFHSNPQPFGWHSNRPHPVKPHGDTRHLLQNMIGAGASLSARLRRVARKRPGATRFIRPSRVESIVLPPVAAASSVTPMPPARA